MAPKVAGIVAEVAKPAPAGPRLDFHGERLAAGHLSFRTKLVQHGFKGDADRRRNLDFLADLESLDGLSFTGLRFHDCPFRGLRDVGDSVGSRARCSAR